MLCTENGCISLMILSLPNFGNVGFTQSMRPPPPPLHNLFSATALHFVPSPSVATQPRLTFTFFSGFHAKSHMSDLSNAAGAPPSHVWWRHLLAAEQAQEHLTSRKKYIHSRIIFS